MATSLINTECKRYGCMKNLLACYANCKYNSRCEELRGEVMLNSAQATDDINQYRQERGLGEIEIQTTKRGLKFVDRLSLQMSSARGKKKIAPTGRIIKARPRTARKPARLETRAASPSGSGMVNVVPIRSKPQVKKPASKGAKKSTAAKVIRLPENKTAAFRPAPQPPTLARKTVEPLADKAKPKVRGKRKASRKRSMVRMETQNRMPRRAKELETAIGNESQAHALSAVEGGQANVVTPIEKRLASGKGRTGKQDAAKKRKKMFIILDGGNSALVDERGLMAKLLAGVSPNARYFEATEIELRLQIAYKK